jgi:hypothetical protein
LSRRLWLPCLSTGWRDWNGCLRAMVITIHKLPAGSFTFLQCLSWTELLNLSGTPYVSTGTVSLSMSETSHNGCALTFLHKINDKCSNGDPGTHHSLESSSNVICLSFCC